MSTVLYTVTTQNKLFDGANDLMQLNRDEDCWYKGKNNYDLISYIVGTRELIGNGVCKYNDHWIDLYRYETLAFGDFTAYEDNGHLWLPEGFNDYGIMNPDELILAMNEGVMFWTDRMTDNPDGRLLYKIFQNY